MPLTVAQRIRLGQIVVDEAHQQENADPPNRLWMADLLAMGMAEKRAFLIALVTSRRSIVQARRTTATNTLTIEETELTNIIAEL